MELSDRVISILKSKKDKIINGGINCIPSPFQRFRNAFAGIEQGKYILCTAATKGYKSQFSSLMFIYNPILYAYNNPDKVKVRIIYYPLEETPEIVVERFICYLLYTRSKGEIRINPQDLRSVNENNPLSDEILNIINSGEYKAILDYFCSCITFSESTNPTGIWNECKRLAEETGTVHKKRQKITDKLTGEVKEVDAYDWYEPKDPNEYKIIYIDHIGLISTERGMDLRLSINKLSEYLVHLRNRYNFTPVVIQQQAFFEDTDAFKLNKLRPTVANLSDSKATSRDANIVLSLFTPFKYNLKESLGYDITRLRQNITFLEVLVNRDGESNSIIALYVDGAVNYFKEMPPPTDTRNMENIYKMLDKIRNRGVINMIFGTKLNCDNRINNINKCRKYGKLLYNFRKKWFW